MNQQILEYLRIIELTECLLGVLLVALLFLVQRLWKRIDGMSMILPIITDEIMDRKKGDGAE